MNDYYKQKLKEGLEFQDYVAVKLAKKGFAVTSFSSKKYQIEKGENLQGFEIKNDQKFRDTGNIYIETYEKSDPKNTNFVPSGIFRSDNTIFYVIGDYDGVFVCQKKILRHMSKKHRQVETATSKGFLFPITEAEKYFDYLEFR